MSHKREETYMSVYSDGLRFEKTRWEKDPYSEEANYLYKAANGKKKMVWREPEGARMSPTKKLLADEELRSELLRLMNFVDFIEYEVVNVRFYDCILDTVEGVKNWKRGIEIVSQRHFAEICGYTMDDGRKALNIAFSQHNR